MVTVNRSEFLDRSDKAGLKLAAGVAILLLGGVCVWPSAAVGDENAGLAVWSVDPLVKVFRDAKPVAGEAVAEVARGEHATWQIVVRCEKPIRGLCAEIGQLALETKKESVLKGATVRFVGYVPVDRPTQKLPKDTLRKVPDDFPDPLLEEKIIDVKAGESQPIWITVAVPQDAQPGLYSAKVHIAGNVDGSDISAEVPVAVRVFNVTVGKSRLWVTNWFSMHWRHMEIAPEADSPEYWALLRRYARNMAEHRQNVAKISPLNLARFTIGEDGKLKIDFSRFDRWVNIFIEEGVIGRIEGGHIGERTKGWNSPLGVSIRKIEDGKVVSVWGADPTGDEADRFHAQFFPALVKHLKEKGWMDRYAQHLADEPCERHVESYRAMVQLVRKYAPGLPILDAGHLTDPFVGQVNIWVPILQRFRKDFTFYQQRQRAGDEVWFYTCCAPRGEYANRFIEQRLIKTRILHWMNYRYGATGYLHWGYNKWAKDSPFTHTTRPHSGPPYLPAGDAWIVYPGRDGPLDSIRHEAMRDGIADYELLSMLGEKDAAAAKRLVEKHVLDFDRYNCNVEQFRATRRELLEALGGQK